MPDHLETVNAYTRRMRGWGVDAINKGEPDRWAPTAEALEAVTEELQRLRNELKPVPASYGDLSDLPPELLSQLSGVKTDQLEDQIYAVVKAAGDEIELDRLLIELFRRYGTVHQRRFLMNKAYRMAQKGLIHLIKGRKGVYTINPQPDAAQVVSEEEEEEEEAIGFTPAPTTAPRETFSADLDDEIPF